ncbi:ABC transporter permease [Microbacterium gorillae]|uniref:ABC transporter permease n=1 Tax=Microbacterium gorillae TaxID=1231063 RepID=UPI00059050AF|nr:ABC transporter permease [Microbacterium gorillae]
MTWVLDNLPLIGQLTLEHLRHSLIPIMLGLLFALPIGWVAYRFTRLRGPVLTVIGLLYTIPSLGLFGVLPALIGISPLSEANLVIALTIYAVAIMTRPVTDAFDSVPAEVRQAATAIGYGPLRRFFTVELPLGVPVMLAGLRVMAVSTVALATVGALIGVNNLGYLFTNGFERRITEEVLSGVVTVALVALVIDGLLTLIGRALTPWLRVGATSRPVRRRAVAA